MQPTTRKLIAGMFILAIGAGCASPRTDSARVGPAESIAKSEPDAAAVHDILVMISDGMEPQQIGLLEEYAEHAP